MEWILPGTTLKGQREDADQICQVFDAMFLAGGLTLSQAAQVTGLETHTIQNWVKRGFLPSPVQKRYDMEQVCRLININLLRGAMPLDQIIILMKYLNGDLSDERDDLVDDTLLYFYFARLASRARYIGGTQAWDDALDVITLDYPEPEPGAREKLIKVLKIMLTVWAANCLRMEAEAMLCSLT